MALPSLKAHQINDIVELIEGWKTKLSWDLLVERVEVGLNIKTTRQTLCTYTSIKLAFKDKKQELRGKPSSGLVKFILSDVEAYERIEKLTAQNKILQGKVQSQLAFVSEVLRQSESNPSLTKLLNNIRQSIAEK